MKPIVSAASDKKRRKHVRISPMEKAFAFGASPEPAGKWSCAFLMSRLIFVSRSRLTSSDAVA
jgi:hypothetical protein